MMCTRAHPAASQPLQAVGPLLTFRCEAREKAFMREFTERRLHLDRGSLLTALALNAVVRRRPGPFNALKCTSIARL